MYSIGQRVIRTADYVSGTVVSAYPYAGTVAYGVRMDNDGDVWSGTEVAWITEDAAPAAQTTRYADASGRTFDTLPDGAVVGPWGSHPWAVLPIGDDGQPVLPDVAPRDVWSGNPETDKVAAHDADHAYRAGYEARMAESNPTGSMPDIPAPWAYRNASGAWSFLATADDWERGYSDADDAIRTNTDRPVQGYGI